MKECLNVERQKLIDAEALRAKVDSKTQVFSNPMLLIESQQEKYFFEQESKYAKQQIEKLQEQLEHKCAEIQQHYVETSQYKTQTNQFLQDLRTSHSTQVKELEENLVRKEEMCLALKQNCDASEKGKIDLAAQVASLEGNVSELSKELQASDSEIKRLNEEMANRSLNDEMMRSEARLLLARNSQALSEENKTLQERIDSHRKEIEDMKIQLERKERLLQKSAETTITLKQQLSQTSTELQKTKTEMDKLKKIAAMVSELQQECQNQRLELTRERLKFDVTSKKLQEFDSEIVAIQTILSDFVSRRRRSDAEAQTHYDEVADIFDSTRISHALSHALAGSERYGQDDNYYPLLYTCMNAGNHPYTFQIR